MGLVNEDAKDATDPSTNSGEFASSGNEKPEEPWTDQSVAAGGADEYPTGLRLVLLAGASIMGVFLISLDQVSSSGSCVLSLPFITDTNGRPSSARPFPRSRPSLMA
jgi:hypothetical protein